MAGMSINENISKNKQQEASSRVLSESLFSDSSTPPKQPVSNYYLSSMLGPQLTGMSMPYNLPPDMMLNPTFLSQQLNYGAMGSLLTQQQLLATRSNFQHLSNLNAQNVKLLALTEVDILQPCQIFSSQIFLIKALPQ